MAPFFQSMVSTTASHPLRGYAGRLRLGWTLLLAFVSLSGSQAVAEKAAADLPPFLFEPLYASNQSSVYGVVQARHADLVLVAGGFDAGFRTGMVLRVQDGSGDVGEVMLVEVRENCAAALILQLEQDKGIKAGQSVRIKTVKF